MPITRLPLSEIEGAVIDLETGEAVIVEPVVPEPPGEDDKADE